MVQNATQGIDVAALVDRLAADLLGRGVVERPEKRACPRERRAVKSRLRQSEITEVRVLAPVAPLDEDVLGLHVRVHQAARVGRVEGARHLRDQGRGAFGLERLPTEEDAQILCRDKTHREEEATIVLPCLVDREDLGVVEGGRELRLAQEAIAEARVVSDLRRDELERD